MKTKKSGISSFPLNVNISELKNIGVPVFIMAILAMMVLPLPPFLLDVFFTFNIAISIMVLIASMYTKKPLEFAVFPSILLITTLLRLALNVASTRVVLMNGHSGTDAAGKVIESFSEFLVGGDLAVGIVVFAILVVINFVVITKGAGRIAEVSARFTLDAMPGKQMAIDADLNAGLIGEKEAKERRADLSSEAEFFGAMDGASKFVRGDAVAGILILFINIIGGISIGMASHGLSFSDAGNVYVLLAIGDGLVAQIPALVISIAAGLVVARVGQGDDIGTQVNKQLLSHPKPFYITASVVGVLGLIPGMPNFIFLTFALILAYCGFKASQLTPESMESLSGSDSDDVKAALLGVPEATWEDVKNIDTISLEVGYRLIPMVDEKQDGDMLKRIKAIRKKFAQEMGFLPPAIHIKDNLDLKANAYRILLKGVIVGQSEIFPDRFMAINPGTVSRKIPGIDTKDPAFDLEAVWIDEAAKEAAQAAGYTIVDSSTVVATHMSYILQTTSHQILGRNEAQALIEHFGKNNPKIIEELVPKILPLTSVQKVLQNLLEEGVHIRDMNTIMESLIEHGPKTQNPVELTGQVRVALGKAIIQTLVGPNDDLRVLVIEPELEQVIAQSQSTLGQEHLAIDPNIAEKLAERIDAAAQMQQSLGQTPTLLVPDILRVPVSKLMRRPTPNLRVLAHSEIPENKPIKIQQVISAA